LKKNYNYFVLALRLSNLSETQAMKSGILLLFVFLTTACNDVFASNSLTEPVIAKQLHSSVSKKQSVLEKIVLKWYKKQLRKKAAVDQPKRTVNILGYLSLIAGVLAPLLIVLAVTAASWAAVSFLGILAFVLAPTAIILGIISLRKRKKLQDKSGTSAIPAFIGLIAGSAFVILVLIALISFSISY
jgi:hypothetical protein